jgi:2-iminoacetate synthase ThiH
LPIKEGKMEKTKTRSAKKITEAVKKIVSMGAEKVVSVGGVGRRSVSKEEISRRIQDKAYELYQRRGNTHGDDQADWYQAECLVKAELGLK